MSYVHSHKKGPIPMYTMQIVFPFASDLQIHMFKHLTVAGYQCGHGGCKNGLNGKEKGTSTQSPTLHQCSHVKNVTMSQMTLITYADIASHTSRRATYHVRNAVNSSSGTCRRKDTSRQTSVKRFLFLMRTMCNIIKQTF